MKDVVSTIEAYKQDVWHYQNLSGRTMDDTMKLLSLQNMMPELIVDRIETKDIQDYPTAKEYAIKQARSIKKGSRAGSGSNSPVDAAEDEEEHEEKENKTRFLEESPEGEKEEAYTSDEFLAWLGKGPGKGSKGLRSQE